jgi:hypothetical protein
VAKALFHPFVKAALIQRGWIITHDPYELKIGDVDMGDDCIIAAEQQGQEIAVVVKGFLNNSSALSEFHYVLGQLINCRIVLRDKEPKRLLYLAIPLVVFNTFFQLDFPKSVIEENKIKLLICNPIDQDDLLWIPEVGLK